MLDQIDLKYFIISFCVGILAVYVMQPKTQIVHKFPSPTNIDQKYKDNTNNCYKFDIEEVQCLPTAVPQPVVIEQFKKKK